MIILNFLQLNAYVSSVMCFLANLIGLFTYSLLLFIFIAEAAVRGQLRFKHMKTEVFIAMRSHILVLWVMVPCSLVELSITGSVNTIHIYTK
jgi:hypothetical protein